MILNIVQRICPAVVQAGANVTLEECEDTLYQVLGNAQQLFVYLVSDETVPNKTEVCNFCFKTDANKTAIVGNLCGKFGTFLFSSCMRAMQSIWCDREVRTLKFERRSRAANEDDYERKRSGRGEVSAEHLFSTLF